MSVYSEQAIFGGGSMVALRNDVAAQTPVRFGILQDASVDFSADVKQLWGQGRYAIMQAAAKTKVEIKAKSAGIRGSLFNSCFFGATTTSTRTMFAENEAGAIPGSTAYTVTVANSATWVTDQGVFYAGTGLPLTKVATGPTAGQYSVSAGVYTFAAADASKAVYISYTWTTSGGVLIPINNLKMGVGPSFQVVINSDFDGRSATYVFNNCMSSKLSLPKKQDDFEISELDFMVAADIAGNIGTISLDL